MVLRGDGMLFNEVPFTGAPLRGIWGSSSNDVWVAAYQGAIQHWDGTGWTAASSDTAVALLGITGTGPNDVWAVGLDGVAFHYDGASWSRTPMGSNDVLWSVWSGAPGQAWAAGAGALHQWNGSVWSP
jgi:hypothetical protein